MSLILGTVYLLHFHRPYHHARHYVGFTRHLGRRIERHRNGRGSPLIEAASNAGIEFVVARVWHNVTGLFERRVHHMQSKLLCPVCIGRSNVRPARPRIADYQERPIISAERPPVFFKKPELEFQPDDYRLDDDDLPF